MNNIKQVFHNYQEYFEKFINILETYSDDLIFEKFLTDKEINQVIDKYQVVSLIKGHVYESRNINNRILEEINQWDSDQLTFFFESIQPQLESLKSVFRGYSYQVPSANLPVFGEGGLYFLIQGSEVLITNFKILEGYFLICQPLFNRLDTKIEKEINPSFNEKNEKVLELIKDLNLYKGEASSRKTKEIYKKKYEDYKRIVEVFEFYILLLVCVSVTLVIAQLFAHDFFNSLNISNAVTIKVTILALIATLFTYCFKQISFYRKISEQAHQTYMELEALPEYLTHLPEDKQNEIRFDLAKRYFGQNLFDFIKEDPTSIQEQAKANAEVLKSTSALLEVIKKQNSSPT